MMPQKINGGLVTAAKWNQLLEYLEEKKLVAGFRQRLRESAAGTVIEAALRSDPAPEPLPAPFEIYPDSGANQIGIGRGAFIHHHGHHADIRIVGAAQGALPEDPGRYLLTLLFQGDWSEWETYVWLPAAGGTHALSLRPGLYPIPIAEMQIAVSGRVRRVTELVPYCRSLPVVEVPDFPFRATMWGARPTAFSVITSTSLPPTKLIIEKGVAPYVMRVGWPPENPWVSVPQMTYTLGEDDLGSLDGLYFLRLKGSSVGICVAACSLPNLARNGGPAWDNANGWAHLPICRVDGRTITQYAGYSQYAVPITNN